MRRAKAGFGQRLANQVRARAQQHLGLADLARGQDLQQGRTVRRRFDRDGLRIDGGSVSLFQGRSPVPGLPLAAEPDELRFSFRSTRAFTWLRQLIQDHLGLTADQANWSYEVTTNSGRTRTLRLDARIELMHMPDPDRKTRVAEWMHKAARQRQMEAQVAQAMRGLVMEVRQGYKSKDSKRQNADMANAAEAYTKGYLPVLIVLSNQIDNDIIDRYERGKWLVLRGMINGEDTNSTYTFAKNVIGYDLVAFFQRNSDQLKSFTESVLESLLQASDDE